VGDVAGERRGDRARRPLGLTGSRLRTPRPRLAPPFDAERIPPCRSLLAVNRRRTSPSLGGQVRGHDTKEARNEGPRKARPTWVRATRSWRLCGRVQRGERWDSNPRPPGPQLRGAGRSAVTSHLARCSQVTSVRPGSLSLGPTTGPRRKVPASHGKRRCRVVEASANLRRWTPLPADLT
jgi:hypothetical protein